MDGFSVEGSGSSYFVRKSGQRPVGPFTTRGRAEDVRDQLLRESKKRERPCITCGASFMSEGPHNRMCDPCREGPHDVEYLS